jgi:hypothetical protein
VKIKQNQKNKEKQTKKEREVDGWKIANPSSNISFASHGSESKALIEVN